MERKLSYYTFYYFMSLVLMRGGGILSKILLARSITPYEYGLITLFVLALPGMFQTITTFCFYDILGHATEGKKYLGFALQYGIFATAVITIIFYIFHVSIFTFLNIPQNYWEILSIIFVIALLSVTLGGVMIGYLRGLRNHSLAATVSTAPSVLRLLFLFFALYLFGIDDFSIIIILFTLPLVFVLVPIIVIKFREISLSLQTVSLPGREMFLFGFSFFILSIWSGLSQQITSVVISHDLGVVWQGYYDVSLSVVAIITFFSSSIYLVSAPETTIKSGISDILRRKGGLGDIGRLLFSLSLLFVVIIYFYANPLISLFFTANYANAADYLYILAIGYAVLFVQQFIGFLSISSDRKGVFRLSLVTVASILMFPVFSHFMIIYFGFTGAYLASTLFILVYTLVTILLFKDRTPLFVLLKKADRLLVVVLGTTVALYILQFSMIPGIIMAVAVFGILAIATGYIDTDLIKGMLAINRKKT
jgi:O-antigen/teichoic acid export membrane protein